MIHDMSPQQKAPAPVPLAEGFAAFGAVAVPDYYHSPSERFLVRNRSGRWLAHSLTSYKRILISRGLSPTPDKKKPEVMAETDVAILEVQNLRDVVRYGRLCGRNSGFYEDGSIRVLVTEDMSLIEPVPGENPTITAILNGLFMASETPEVGAAQIHTFLGWMQSSVVALRAGSRQQQQALVICGIRDCGKSFVQHQIITPSLAGRHADAARVFLRGNDFNGDLFEAEHLFLDDCTGSLAIRDRLAFGAILKAYTVGATVKGLHAKGRDAITLAPWWRISITCNDDPEAMMV
ncbi:MAG: hypothetical protein WCJ66_17395, partial [Verrucomicrobiota bacterium]